MVGGKEISGDYTFVRTETVVPKEFSINVTRSDKAILWCFDTFHRTKDWVKDTFIMNSTNGSPDIQVVNCLVRAIMYFLSFLMHRLMKKVNELFLNYQFRSQIIRSQKHVVRKILTIFLQ